ncbi:hypothetical protein [uncultured Anaerofustis sp.]|nr:hypothetical protein [uncultured Anaerofustis sp.]
MITSIALEILIIKKTKTYFKGHHARFIKIDISGIKGWLFTDEVSVY